MCVCVYEMERYTTNTAVSSSYYLQWLCVHCFIFRALNATPAAT